MAPGTATDGLGTTGVAATTNATTGALNIYVGGSIAPTSSQPTEQYNGTITVTVTY